MQHDPILTKSAAVGVHSIDHFALVVPDIAEAARFCESFGLNVEHEADALSLRAAGSDHVWARILPGDYKQLAYLSFNCNAVDFDALYRQVERAGGLVAEPHARHRHADGFWAHDPDGNLLQIRIGAKTSPDLPHFAPQVRPKSLRGAVSRSAAPTVNPRRLSHVLLFTPDLDRQLAFYIGVLGLGLSDRSRDIIGFTHGRHGSDHHLVAFAKSTARGWHHSSWDVRDAEEVGLGWMQMQDAGYGQVWGPGRHVLGSNHFCYVRDPWGSYFEYSAGIDHVSAGTAWPAGDHDPEDSLYLWGPPVPAEFIENGETATP